MNLPSRDSLFYPFEETFNNFYSQFFNDANTTLNKVKSKAFYPKIDIIETENEYRIEASVPGMSAQDIDVEVFQASTKSSDVFGIEQDLPYRSVRISGKSNEDNNYEKAKFHIRELKRSRFERVVNLPEYAVGDPEASLSNGILALKWITMKKEVPKLKKINIIEKD